VLNRHRHLPYSVVVAAHGCTSASFNYIALNSWAVRISEIIDDALLLNVPRHRGRKGELDRNFVQGSEYCAARHCFDYVVNADLRR
jgi:hypothetical protein